MTLTPLPMLHDQHLLSRLTELRPVLERSGGVVVRRERGRRPSYRLRCRVTDPDGKVRQIAIPVAETQVAAVRELIAQWRVPEHARRELAAQADADRRELRRARKQLRLEVLAQVGVGEWRRRLVAKAFRDAERGGDRELFDFVVGLQFEVLSRKPGRPKKRSLVLPVWT